ncbi:MAG TPA: DUF2281 domain-containing protein [Candidatus Hydrogenedentes bacterium]|nr:DUF2281 domain-containing protein [Candidatus Hydrogenedentota bacterium]HNT87654.1 DUF2281 domain-containing protein [Candidatus Hydrogenedentota bacterium]
MLSDSIDRLPPQIKKQVIEYIEFLGRKHGICAKREPFRFAWAGGLSHLKDQFTAVELQHQAARWR